MKIVRMWHIDDVQREGCGQRVGDDLRLTVTDEERRVALLEAWSEIQRCLNHPGLHLTYDQLHNSEPAKNRKCNAKAVEATGLRTSTFAMLDFGWQLCCCPKKNIMTTTECQN